MSDKVKNVAKSLLFGFVIVVSIAVAIILLISVAFAAATAMQAHPAIGTLCVFLALVVIAAIVYYEEHF